MSSAPAIRLGLRENLMLNSGALKEFHANDEEILVRHLHKVVQETVAKAEADKLNKKGRIL